MHKPQAEGTHADPGASGSCRPRNSKAFCLSSCDARQLCIHVSSAELPLAMTFFNFEAENEFPLAGHHLQYIEEKSGQVVYFLQ